MQRRELIRGFLADVGAQRLRTALTVLGIAWGTVAVAVLLAFGVGLQHQMLKEARGLGDGIVILMGGTTTKPYRGFPEGRNITLRPEDVGLLEREVPEIAQIGPEYGGRLAPVRVGRQIANPYITGVTPVYGEMRNIFAQPGGRFLDAPDIAERRRVVFLGDAIKTLLFGEADAVGRTVMVGETPFTVIGVMVPKAQNSSYNARDKDRIFIPASTFASVFAVHTLRDIVFKPASPELSKPAIAGVYRVLGRRYHFDESDRDAVSAWDTNDIMHLFDTLFTGLNLFLGMVGSFTLLVGGIGVANIMYIVVRERRREIGIKRSLGARRVHILAQFMGEALFIVALGAILGLVTSIAIVRLAALLPIQSAVGTPTLSPLVLAVTLLLLAAVALLAGFFPARRAATLEPVQCLRA